MRKADDRIMLIVLSLFILTMFMGCSGKNNVKDAFSIEQFENEMKAKNYNFEIKDVEKDFLPTTRKRMIIGNEVVDIYLFSNNKKMEKEAKCIDSGGNVYSDGSKVTDVSWPSPPRFYKRGSIIVQYIGGNEKIISDLKDILGEHFAGGE